MFSLILCFLISLFILLSGVFFYRKGYISLGIIISLFSGVFLFTSFYIILSGEQEEKSEVVIVQTNKEVEKVVDSNSSNQKYTVDEISKVSACKALTMGKTAVCIKGIDPFSDSEIIYSEKLDKCLIKYVYRAINEVGVSERTYSYVLEDVEKECKNEERKNQLLNEFNN